MQQARTPPTPSRDPTWPCTASLQKPVGSYLQQGAKSLNSADIKWDTLGWTLRVRDHVLRQPRRRKDGAKQH